MSAASAGVIPMIVYRSGTAPRLVVRMKQPPAVSLGELAADEVGSDLLVDGVHRRAHAEVLLVEGDAEDLRVGRQLVLEEADLPAGDGAVVLEERARHDREHEPAGEGLLVVAAGVSDVLPELQILGAAAGNPVPRRFVA